MRTEKTKAESRSFGFRAYDSVLKTLVTVHACSFDSMDGEAAVSIIGSPVIFVTKMSNLTLLEHTSRQDVHGTPIYEGDIVRASVQNEYGSFEEREGPVLFNEYKWGFSVDFGENFALPLTGVVMDVEIVGNIFENAAYEEKVPSKKKRTRTPKRK